MRFIMITVLALFCGVVAADDASQRKVAVAQAEANATTERNKLPDAGPPKAEATPTPDWQAVAQAANAECKDLRYRVEQLEKELADLNAWKERLSVQLATLEKQVGDHDVMLRAPTLAEEKPDDAWKDKEAEVFCFSPSETWFHCPACVKFHKDSETMVLPFNLIFGEMDQAEAKRLQVPANAKFPLFRIGNKGETQWYWVWFERGLTQESLVKRFEEVHK